MDVEKNYIYFFVFFTSRNWTNKFKEQLIFDANVSFKSMINIGWIHVMLPVLFDLYLDDFEELNEIIENLIEIY